MRNKHRFDKVTIDRLNGTAAGETVYVFGNGLSLKTFDFGRVGQCKSIGTNRILRTGFKPSYVLFLDNIVWQKEETRILNSDCALLVGEPLAFRLEGQLPAGRFLVFRYSPQVGIAAHKGALHQGNLSGYYATEVAARMIQKDGRIVLVGMEMSYDKNYCLGGKTHFFDDPQKEGCNDRSFPNALKCFEVLRSALNGRGIETVVVGPSRLLEIGWLAA